MCCFCEKKEARPRRGVIAPRRVKSGGVCRPQAKLSGGSRTNLMRRVAFGSGPYYTTGAQRVISSILAPS